MPFRAVLLHAFLCLTCSDLLNIVSQAQQTPSRAHVEILRPVSEAARMPFTLAGGLSWTSSTTPATIAPQSQSLCVCRECNFQFYSFYHLVHRGTARCIRNVNLLHQLDFPCSVSMFLIAGFTLRISFFYSYTEHHRLCA